MPGFRSEIQLRRADLAALRKQRSQLCFIQLPQTAKVVDAGKIVDRDQAQLRLAEFALRKPIEQIAQMNLAEEIMLEPQHDFFVIDKPRQRFLLFAQLFLTILEVDSVRVA